MQNLFSYPLVVDELSAAQRRYKFKADEKELKFIADVLKVVDAKSFEADLNVKLSKKEHQLKVWGKVRAELELMSVISLETLPKPMSPNLKSIMTRSCLPRICGKWSLNLTTRFPTLLLTAKSIWRKSQWSKSPWLSTIFPVRTAKFSSLNRNSTRRPRKR